MVNKDFFAALDDWEKTKGIPKDVFLEALQTALVSAYKRDAGEASNIEVRINQEKSTIKVFAFKTVVETVEDADKEISLEEAKTIKTSSKIGDTIGKEIVTKDFGRIAAQTAKQIINQRLREKENEKAFEELSDKAEKLIVGVIRRIDGQNVYVDIGGSEAILLPNDQIPGEQYRINDTTKVYVKNISIGNRGPRIMVSRASEQLVKRLFEQEVPELTAGVVEIKNIVREAGYRTKMSVHASDPSVDPVGACIGSRGMRVNAVIMELVGEKVDIIQWCEDPLEYIARALSPAKVEMVSVDFEAKSAIAIVPDDKLSLAIGKGGQNARLAVKLTGWKIDVKSVSAAKDMDDFRDIYAQESNAAISENAATLESGIDGDKTLGTTTEDVVSGLEELENAYKNMVDIEMLDSSQTEVESTAERESAASKE